MSRAAALVAALLTVSCASAPLANAALVAEAGSSSTVTSGVWAVAPTSSSVTSAPDCQQVPSPCGPFTSPSGALTTSNPVYFNIWNTGSEQLDGLTYEISFSGAKGSPAISLTACTGPWFVFSLFGLNITWCWGTQQTVLTGTAQGSFPVTTAVPVQPGNGVYLQAALDNGRLSTLTVSTSVGPPDVVATTTNN